MLQHTMNEIYWFYTPRATCRNGDRYHWSIRCNAPAAEGRRGEVDRYTQRMEAGFFGLRAKLGQQKTSCTLRFDNVGLNNFVPPADLVEMEKIPKGLNAATVISSRRGKHWLHLRTQNRPPTRTGIERTATRQSNTGSIPTPYGSRGNA